MIQFEPIGVIHSPFKETGEIPRQSIYASDKRAVVEIREDLKEGLNRLEKSRYIVLLFYFHKSDSYELLQYPHGRTEASGVFATRSPRRPNPIGMSIVKLVNIDGCNLEIEGVDMLDGTPVLDIKPYSEGLNPPSENEA